MNDAAAGAPVPSCAVTVTVDVPAVDGVPVIVPPLEIEVPAGSPVALKLSVWPLVRVGRGTGTDTAVPAMPSCGPGLVMVTGWPSWADVHRQRAGQRQVRVGVADRDAVAAGGGGPGAAAGVPVRRLRWVSGNETVWLAPGLQVHPGEPLQLAGRLARRGRVGHVQLGHVGARPGTRCWSRWR